MKKLKLSFAVVLLLGVAACTKNYNSGPRSNVNGNVSNGEAADMVANSLASSSNGVANISAQITLNAASLINTRLACGTTRADSINAQSPTGASVTYSYHQTYNYTLKCDTGSQPDSIYSSLIYNGSFNGPNLSSGNSGSSIFTVGGLLSSSTDFVINGEYKQSGSFQSKTDTTNTGSNNIDMVIKTLTVQKSNHAIVGGTATISVNGDVPKKGNFSYTGTLVFNANGAATLTLNGTVYTINLTTGQRFNH